MMPSVAVTATTLVDECEFGGNVGCSSSRSFSSSLPWGAYVSWRQGPRTSVPMFADGRRRLLGAVRAGAVLGGARSFCRYKDLRDHPQSTVQQPSSWRSSASRACGSECRCGCRLAAEKLPDVVDHPESWVYVRVVLWLERRSGSVRPVWLGADARQVMTMLVTLVPNVAFILLMNRYLAEPRRPWIRASGQWRQSVRLAAWHPDGSVRRVTGRDERRAGCVEACRFPWLPVVLVLSVVFLQVGKEEFRTMYWE